MERFYFSGMAVYRMAIEFAVEVDGLVAGLPRHRRPAGDQLMRASLSAMLNIAEGSGEYRPAEKSRFYRMARRSCYESAAAMDFLHRTGSITPVQATAHEHRLSRISAALTALIHTMESRPPKAPRPPSPKAPKAPKAPTAPTAPKAPKAPTAPSAPEAPDQ